MIKINFIKKTNNTIKNKQDLIENFKNLSKKRGYSIDCKENEDLMICYGAPIFDSTSNIVAAISFSDVRNNDYSDEEIGGFVKRMCFEYIKRFRLS
ncbi:MAG: IclR family transcriptional regulator C-terminal domain-containing protein [Clostridium sp.]|nr:MAG: IclR family transcriptional regulator C-terminal domain-containing protein [Clostridium sp.]